MSRVSRAHLALMASLVGLGVFFLTRPLFGDRPYYHPRPPGTAHDYWYLFVLTFVPYALALRSHLRGERSSAKALVVGVVFVYLLFIPTPPQQSQDVYQYLVYGDMAASGANPYVETPDPADPWTRYSLYDDTPSVYGPLWTAVTMFVAKVADGDLSLALLLIKAVAAVAALAATGALLSAANRKSDEGFERDPALAVTIFAYNPMVVASVGLGAHADVAVAATLGGAVVAFLRGRHIATMLLLVAASLVKIYAGLVLVAWILHLFRRRGLRVAALASAGSAFVVGLAWIPWWKGWETLQGIAEVGQRASASLAGGLMRLLSGRWNATAGETGIGTAVRILGAIIVVLAIVKVARSVRNPIRDGALLLGVYFLVTPWFLYWHAVGLVTLVAVVSEPQLRRPTLVFSGTSLALLPGGLQTLVRYAPPLLVAPWRAHPHPVDD